MHACSASLPRTHHHGDQCGDMAMPYGEVAQDRGAAEPRLCRSGGGSMSCKQRAPIGFRWRGGGAVGLWQDRHTQACNLQGSCQRVCPRHREESDHPTAPVPTQEQPGQHQPHHPPTPSLQMESTPFEFCLNLSMSPVASLPTP